MTAEMQLNHILVFVQQMVDQYTKNRDEANERMQRAEKEFSFEAASIHLEDAIRYESLLDFGRSILDYADDLKKIDAVTQMRTAALGGLTDIEYEEKITDEDEDQGEASDDDGLMDGLDLLRFLRNVQ